MQIPSDANLGSTKAAGVKDKGGKAVADAKAKGDTKADKGGKGKPVAPALDEVIIRELFPPFSNSVQTLAADCLQVSVKVKNLIYWFGAL